MVTNNSQRDGSVLSSPHLSSGVRKTAMLIPELIRRPCESFNDTNRNPYEVCSSSRVASREILYVYVDLVHRREQLERNPGSRRRSH